VRGSSDHADDGTMIRKLNGTLMARGAGQARRTITAQVEDTLPRRYATFRSRLRSPHIGSAAEQPCRTLAIFDVSGFAGNYHTHCSSWILSRPRLDACCQLAL
jgi:hypothetical protein